MPPSSKADSAAGAATGANALPAPSFAVGISAWATGGTGSAQQFGSQAAMAEELGFRSFWLPENHFGERGAIPAPLLLLAAAAAATQRIRLGTGSYLLTIRHPVLMAEEVAVLDRLSEGRVVLGVGRGYLGSMFAGFDATQKQKRERFESALMRMIDAWKGEPIATDPGTGVEKVGAGEPVFLSPRPVQTPHPPVWVAAFGPKALEQAGRLGLPYLASPMESFEVLRENFDTHAAAAEAAGQEVPIERVAMRSVFVSRDTRQIAAVKEELERHAATLAKSPMAAIRRGAGRVAEDWTIIGEPEAVKDQIAQYREEMKLTHLIATRSRMPEVPNGTVRGSIELLGELLDDLHRTEGKSAT